MNERQQEILNRVLNGEYGEFFLGPFSEEIARDLLRFGVSPEDALVIAATVAVSYQWNHSVDGWEGVPKHFIEDEIGYIKSVVYACRAA